MALFGSRRNQVVRRRSDGTFDLVLDAELRRIVTDLLGELDDLVDAGTDDPSLRRLAPPAYLDDPDKDAEYQLLAGDELRSSRHDAIGSARATLGKDRVSEEELWAWLQALNALRLVVGTRLGIEDEDHEEVRDDDAPDAPLWALYDLSTWLQWSVIRALDR